jgi:glycyl-tRNA synthetase
MSEVSLDTIVSLAKRRGFVFPSSEIYGGLAGFYDYGPYGAQMVKNIKDAWWEAFVRSVPNIHGLDSSIIQHPKLWEASGHVAGFNDPLVDCKNCQARHRADQLAGVDSTNIDELTKLIAEKACPNCGQKGQFTEVRQFNMMMKTYLGPSEESESTAYLRPETAGGIFTNFDLVRETTRAKIPFGIGQIGKAFRNEISPRDFVFRVRELEQMEMQYFVDPKNETAEYENLRQFNWDFLRNIIGLHEENLQWHEHGPDERAHYANAAHDIQFKYPFGFKELWGTHNRTDFDLKSHMAASGKDLKYFDPESNTHYIPYVMESSVGVGRLFLAALIDAYQEETVNQETRIVLKLQRGIAPIDVAVLPLSKKPELAGLARDVYKRLVAETNLTVEYDETQSIGKRYRRQDEIGTPLCVTVDFDSLDDQAVTVRDRDTMEQKRVSIASLTTEL